MANGVIPFSGKGGMDAAGELTRSAYKQGVDAAMRGVRYTRCDKHKDIPQQHVITSEAVHVSFAPSAPPPGYQGPPIPNKPECPMCMMESVSAALLEAQADIRLVAEFIVANVVPDTEDDPIMLAALRLKHGFAVPENEKAPE